MKLIVDVSEQLYNKLQNRKKEILGKGPETAETDILRGKIVPKDYGEEKFVKWKWECHCPTCGRNVENTTLSHLGTCYCMECGQKIRYEPAPSGVL